MSKDPSSGRPELSRRSLLAGGAALASAGLLQDQGQAATGDSPGLPERRHAVYLVPGYVPESAHYKGRPIAEQNRFTKAVPASYQGLLTMVSRVDERDGSVRRALFPLAGHEITVRPDRRSALFNGMDDPFMLSFDPDSLERGILASAHAEDFRGGGHALYVPAEGPLVVAERKLYGPYSGKPEDHFGRIVLRDPETLKVLEVYNSHGIAPHQIGLLTGEQVLAIAHYGSTAWPDGEYRDDLPYLVEPCLTLIDLANGKLLHKEISPDKAYDLRHLALHGRDRIFAIQGRLSRFAATQEAMVESEEVYEPDIWSGTDRIGYLPAPLFRFDLTKGQTRPSAHSTADPLLMRYGQSIVYDPLHDEAIATYPTRHCVIVFGGNDGEVRHVIRTDRLGLQQPRGIGFHPDGKRYAVTGYWRNIFLFERGSHALDREACLYETLFGHSHSTVF